MKRYDAALSGHAHRAPLLLSLLGIAPLQKTAAGLEAGHA